MGSLAKRISLWICARSFSSKVSLFFVGLLLCSLAIALLEYQSDGAIEEINESQASIYKLNRRLADIGQTVQKIRGHQLRRNNHPDSASEALDGFFFVFKQESDALAEELSSSDFHALTKSFATFRLLFSHYEESSKAIVAIQKDLGFRASPGLLAEMRVSASAITKGFAALKRNDLIVEFNDVQFAEREYQRTLNMQFSDAALSKLLILQKRWSIATIAPLAQVDISKNLTQYQQMAERFGRLVLEIELRNAEATLTFSRALAPLRSTEIAMDAKLVSLGQALRSQRKDAARLQMLTLLASAAFVLLLLIVLLRGNLHTRDRLKTLATDVRDSTDDFEVHITSEESDDDIAALASGFGKMSCQLTEQIATIEAARDQATRANEAKSRFIATVSHEIRTPMNGLLATLQLMEQTPLDEEQRDYVDIMRLSGDRMLELLSDLLDFSKVDANKIVLRNVPFSLTECAHDAVTLFKASAEAKGLGLNLSLHDVSPGHVIGDHSRLRQTLLNLISNAIKYTEAGEVNVRLEVVGSQDRAGVSDTEEIRFTVTDTGIGIPSGELDALFDPFSQVDDTLTRRHAGTGLGLAICDRLVALAGGKLLVTSEVGMGSTFQFTISYKRSTCKQQEHSPQAEPHRVVLPKDLAKDVPIRIVLAEDDPTTRRTMKRLFKRLGYDPLIVNNGMEAVKAVKDGGVDLVFMDMQMPVLDGLRAAARIREICGGKGPIIIGLSGNASDVDQQRCLNAGMSDFLAKPFELEKFVAKIRQWGGER